MPLAELFRVAWAALRAHKLRTLLTMLGIVIAVWTIVSVLAVIGGMNAYVRTQVFSLRPDVIVVTRLGIITSFEEFLRALKRKEISDREIVRLEELCRSCAEVAVNLQGTRAVHAGDRRLSDVPLFGTSANYAHLENVDLVAGRFFTDFEAEHSARVAVIGSEVREELFPRLDPIGRTVWIGGQPHEVIGVKAKQGSVLGQSRDTVAYIPYRTAARLFGSLRGRRIDVQVNLLVRAQGGVPGIPAARDETIQVFRWLRQTPIRAEDPVSVITPEMLESLWRQISVSIFFVIVLIASISLLVGAIVVANIMIVSVVERTREIGLRLALGARKRDVRRQFLIESALLALAGGALGSGAAVLTAAFIDANAPVPATAGPGLVLLAVGVAGLTGLAAGFLPARMAANLTPIEALRRD